MSGTIKSSPPAHHLMPASRQIIILLAHPTPRGGGLYEADEVGRAGERGSGER